MSRMRMLVVALTLGLLSVLAVMSMAAPKKKWVAPHHPKSVHKVTHVAKVTGRKVLVHRVVYVCKMDHVTLSPAVAKKDHYRCPKCRAKLTREVLAEWVVEKAPVKKPVAHHPAVHHVVAHHKVIHKK